MVCMSDYEYYRVLKIPKLEAEKDFEEVCEIHEKDIYEFNCYYQNLLLLDTRSHDLFVKYSKMKIYRRNTKRIASKYFLAEKEFKHELSKLDSKLYTLEESRREYLDSKFHLLQIYDLYDNLHKLDVFI